MTTVISGDTGIDKVAATVITALTEDTTPDGAADYLLIYDTSAGALKKVLPDSLTPSGGSGTRFCALFSGSSYTPQSDVDSFLAMVYGAVGGHGVTTFGGGVGGAGYSEKHYATPSGSYSYSIGAAGSTSGGVGSGGTINFTGGTGGNGDGTRGGGAGGGAGRSGNGGNGANQNGSVGGGGGGTGGNNASGGTGGAAATTLNGSAYPLGTIENGFRFLPGVTPVAISGGGGAPGDELLNITLGFTGLSPAQLAGTTAVIGSNTSPYASALGSAAGARGGQSYVSGIADAQGCVFIVEFLK